MRVALFVPCFVDAIYPAVAESAVRVLERLGHEVVFPCDQTCCGQPPFNAGDWEASREVARHQVRALAGHEVVVALSGSCGAMLKVFYRELFAGDRDEALALEVAGATREFADFLTNVLGVEDVGARFEARATYHDGCHGLRELGLKEAPRRLLWRVRGLELLEMEDGETCCGFGGLFSVKFPMISAAMGEVKCEAILATGADVVISGDSSCLMHIGGMLARQGRRKRCLHFAEVLAME